MWRPDSRTARCHADCNRNANPDNNTNTYPHADPNPDNNTYPNTDSHPDAYPH